MTAVKNKILDVKSLVKKTDYNAKVESKYITTDNRNKFTKDITDNNMKSKGLVKEMILVDL